jgi:putative membrane protein
MRTAWARLRSSIAFASFIVAIAGCGGDDNNGSPDLDAVSDLGVPAFDQGFARASEADIASILLTLNTGEVMVAQAALPKLATTAARNFAQMMIDMHGAARTREVALFQQIGITPNDNNAFTIKLTAETNQAVTIIGRLSGGELDRFYIDTQVDMHKEALDLIDFVMLPNATTPALVTEIVTTRAAVVTHLNIASMLQATFGTDGGL